MKRGRNNKFRELQLINWKIAARGSNNGRVLVERSKAFDSKRGNRLFKKDADYVNLKKKKRHEKENKIKFFPLKVEFKRENQSKRHNVW